MTVYAISNDLMDGSKLRAGLVDVVVVRAGVDLDGATMVTVDLRVAGGLEAALGTGARVIAYGSHVDEDALAAATAAGAQALPRSVFFRRLRDGTLLD